uniref:HSF-type DNA-binding domain-containing protein n=1 Tax=Naja naja TaxID=35670 RepID=A0A8C6YH15_NAJNA
NNKTTAILAFLSKLWVLVDAVLNNQPPWFQNGQTFLLLVKQRFNKAFFPKYFKHSSMASFANIYGFHTLVEIDSGIVIQERNGPVDFQYKISSSRPEENKICHRDLSKILNNVLKIGIKQETETDRSAKHLQQQLTIQKTMTFIATVLNNQLVTYYF